MDQTDERIYPFQETGAGEVHSITYTWPPPSPPEWPFRFVVVPIAEVEALRPEEV